MKILIITQPLGKNYGGILQAYALQKYLTDLGHQCVTLNWNNYTGNIIWFLVQLKHKLKKIIKIAKTNYAKSFSKRLSEIYLENSFKFIEKHIKVTEHSFKTSDKLNSSVIDGFDAVIVGSDQCWASQKPSQYVKTCMLDFLKDIEKVKKISYAPSFGQDTFCNDKAFVKECANLLKHFDSVSVREDSGIVLCDKIFGIGATQVIDPTLLLNFKHYIDLSYERNDFINDGDLFSYILDDTLEKQSIVSKISKALSMKPFRVVAKSNYENVGPRYIKDCVLPPVEQWLRAIAEAKYVVTDSF